ncbi:MAG: hypothetical protein KF688_01570 [Pirellulales bacterium]|nr:hypothetical protein [Pirellulales bacterium]MBX3434205.1 hypothetical protein [Pirellulales bacterium]
MSQDSASPSGKRSLLTLLKALAFVSTIVLLEIVAASMILPSAEDVEKVGVKLASDASSDKAGEGTDGATPRVVAENTREVSLGSYHVLTYDPNTGTSVNIDFDLFGTVLANEESAFTEMFLVNQNRISEQVTVTMRGMEITDFTDADLDVIKRKLLDKANRALGKPLLRQIVIPKFSFIER